MKYAYVLAFGALALAQSESCQSVVTETEYETFYVCPCSSTTAPLLPSGITTSTTPGGGQVGPTLIQPTPGTSATGSISIAPPPPVISPATTTGPSVSIADPPLSSGGSPPPPPPVVSTTTGVVSPPSPPVTPGATQVIALSTLGDYQSRALFSHNLHRANSTIPNLVWNTTQVDFARQLAQTCVYGHSNAQGDGQYGQNIGAGFTADEIPIMITNSMYNMEINFFPQYDVNNVDLSNFAAWGHFSQIIWRDTVSVGCFTQDCSATGLANTGGGVRPLFTVCNYYPPGNVDGLWSRVARPQGGGTVQFR